MGPADITAMKLASWGGERVFNEAMEIAKSGRVLSADWDPATKTVSGEIITGAAHTQKSAFKLLDDGYIHSLCPCQQNREYGTICKHVIALGCMIMLRRTDPAREARYQSEKRATMRAVTDPSKCIQRAPDGVPAKLQFAWGAGFAEEFAAGKVKIHVAFDLPEGRRLTPTQLPQGMPLALSETDDDILSVLEDIAGGVLGDTVDALPADFLNLIELKACEGKVHCTLRADFEEESGCFTLYPYADIPGQHIASADKFLVDGNVGFVYSNRKWYKLDKVLPGPFQFVYRDYVRIERRDMPSFLRQQYPQLRKLCDIELYPSEDLFEFVPEKPSIRAVLNGSKASLRLDLFACYGGTEIRCGDPLAKDVCEPDPDDVMRYRTRDVDAERKALALVQGYGFRAQNPDSPSLHIADQRHVFGFLGSGVPYLNRLGWKVELSPTLDKIVEDNPHIVPVVTVSDADRGSFDVGMSFEAKGVKIPHAVVQRAINTGSSILDFEGCSYLVDTEAIESMRKVFEDCSTGQGSRAGTFRVGGVYAPFVKASLDALDGVALDDEQAEAWRESAARRNRDESAKLEPVPLGALEGTLRPYQKEGVYWMRFLEKSALCGLLADEMGLGKTLQTLTWISLERCNPDSRGKPAIVVCPTSLVENWNREAEKFVPHLNRLVVSGPDRAESFDKIKDADLVITSYALLQRDLEDAYMGVEFSVAVLDEAQHVKNRQTRNAKSVKRLKADCKLALTGTPVENSVSDVWSIFDFLMPDYLGDYESFKMNTEDPIAEGGKNAAEVQAKLKRKLHPFIMRRVKKDVAKDLPDKIVRTQFCTMTPEQQRVYAAILAQAKGKIGDMVKQKGFAKSKFEILALLTKLRQCSCHLSLLKEFREGKLSADREEMSGKVDAFLELLDEARGEGHRMLVFSQFTSMLAVLKEELDARGIPYCYLDGSTKNRLDICAKFNTDRSIPVFLISLHAGGTGLTLTGADMVVHFDPWWNPAVEDQATDRAHRIGQKKTVFVVKMIAQGSVEERVLALQKKKQLVIDATVGDTDSATLEKLTYDDVRQLLS